MKDQKQIIVETYKDLKVTELFDKERSKFSFQKYKHQIEANFLKREISSLEGKKIKILDIACGTGRMLPEVFSTGKDVEYLGFDTSAEMTRHLKEKAKRLGIENKVKIKLGDATKLPFNDGEFDFVYTYHLLWHIPKEEQERIIKEMLRVCKKGGLVVFDMLNEKFLWESLKSILGKNKTENIYKMDIMEARKILGKKEITLEKINDFPVKNNFLFGTLNIFNRVRKALPLNLYHMVYLAMEK